MRGLWTVLALLLALIPVPASAVGGDVSGEGGCIVLTDPIGDTLNPVVAWGLADHPHPDAHARVDVRDLRMAVEGDTLWAILEVQDLSAPRRPTTLLETYSVSWQLGDRLHSRYVRRWAPGWTLLMGHRETRAVLDEARDEVRIPIPLDAVPGTAQDTVLTGITADTTAWEGMIPMITDRASVELAEGIGGSFPLDGDCAPRSDPGRCLAGADPEGDPEGARDDPSTDITGVEVGSDHETLAVGVRVADLLPSVSGPSHRERWSVEWASGGEPYAVEAWRDANGYSSALYRTPEGRGFAQSRLEPETDTVVVRLPRSLVGIEDGVELTDLRATTTTSVRRAYQDVEVGGDASERFEHVVGEACGLPLPAVRCPVVADPEGDAEPPLGADAVDLLAAGATSDPEAMRVSARAVDPTAGPPRGFDTAGWTISWSDGERDWYAQAEHGPEGPRFRYGTAARDDRRDEPLGPRFGGRATSGTIDRDTGVVAVDVPRFAVEGLHRFGATAWAMRGAPGAAVHRVFDETDLGAYRTGTSCGA